VKKKKEKKKEVSERGEEIKGVRKFTFLCPVLHFCVLLVKKKIKNSVGRRIEEFPSLLITWAKNDWLLSFIKSDWKAVII
jgi:hypothetical protein